MLTVCKFTKILKFYLLDLKKQLESVKHHLYGFQPSKINFSTGKWLKLVKKKYMKYPRKNKIPIIVGVQAYILKLL